MPFTKDELNIFINELSYGAYLDRIQEKLKRMYHYIINEQSTNEEVEADREQACTFIMLKIFDRKITFNNLDTDCLQYLELVWLDTIKLNLAYYIYLNNTTDTAIANYYRSCNTIRNWLLNNKLLPDDFKIIQDYLVGRYVKENHILDNSFTKALISRKAARLCKITGNTNDTENWTNAELFVKTFYENILPTVNGTPDKQECTKNILKVLSFIQPNAINTHIINGLEITIAIFFLDKLILEGIIPS
jgi:hypothetical protein